MYLHETKGISYPTTLTGYILVVKNMHVCNACTVTCVTSPSVAADGVLVGERTPRLNGNDSVEKALGHTPTSVSMNKKWEE